jgi:hypothetical protein
MHASKRQVLTPSTAQPTDTLPTTPCKADLIIPNSTQIDTFLDKLTLLKKQTTGEKGKTKEHQEVIEAKRRKLKELEELHAANVEMIVRNERELDELRRKQTHGELNKRKKELSAGAKLQYERFEGVYQSHFLKLQQIPSTSLPETHPNKLISLLLTQIQLYEGQIQQRQGYFEQICSRLSLQTHSILSDSANLAADIHSTSLARRSDLQNRQKLVRSETYKGEIIRNLGKKPLDEVARTAGEEVVQKLREKMRDKEGNAEFLRSLEEKLKGKGVKLEL